MFTIGTNGVALSQRYLYNVFKYELMDNDSLYNDSVHDDDVHTHWKGKPKMRDHFTIKDMDAILDAMHDDLLITDGEGVVIRVSPSFENLYGITQDFALGKTVYELEEAGFFKPSVIARVLQDKKKITMRQRNNQKRDIIVSATPVFGNDGNITMVVSFSRDITEMLQLQEQYNELELEIKKYAEEIKILRQEATGVEGVIGNSESWKKILQTIKRVAGFDVSILFLGPSGVGKTMLAKIVHQCSDRSNGPFIAINCAAIPENLLESELFGYEKGSFSGANAGGKVGLIELAKGGTLLLDEISEMPLSLQAKLLKAIQDKAILRVGGVKEIPIDFRLITACNRDLDDYAERGLFRKDLLYRLNVINIKIPPLCERKEDIIPLMNYFLEKYNHKYSLNKSFHPSAIDAFINYPWTGNAREMSNIIERILLTTETNQIHREDLVESMINTTPLETPQECNRDMGLDELVELYEAQIICKAYKEHQSTVGVAKALKISQPTAFRKVRKYIPPKETIQ